MFCSNIALTIIDFPPEEFFFLYKNFPLDPIYIQILVALYEFERQTFSNY